MQNISGYLRHSLQLQTVLISFYNRLVLCRQAMGNNLRVLVPLHRNKDTALKKKSTYQVSQDTTNLVINQPVFSLIKDQMILLL